MKISLNWLKYYVDINVPVQELCDKMVMAGFEVEEMENTADRMSNVVVGKIKQIVPHPDSDHLLICTMDVGTGEDTQIVTGASNVFEGAFVPAALHDSHLPNGMHIKKGKLRGVPSNGMLCSGEELLLKEEDYPGASVNGIMILKEEYTPGTDMREVLGLNDWIIDFKITANRPDCQSVIGVAREVGVVLGKEFKLPNPTFQTKNGNINEIISVTVENFDLCPRYMGRVVKNLRIAESPEWMKKCLKAAGMRPINNIVDITNFVMLETGQPMHAFDLREIEGNKIIVRTAKDGETITTLDGKPHELNSNMLVIADAEKPSCMAGIMGGAGSGIKDDTTDLFFESAKFRRDSVRRTSRALGLRTESSGRYERGTDIQNVEYAMNRALGLIYDLDAGDIIDGVIDQNEGLPEDRKIVVTAESVCALLGVKIPADTMANILNSLQIKTTLEGDTLTCLVPSFRDDVEGRADIAEEVMRIYGYDHIIGTPMRGNILRGHKTPAMILRDKVKSLLNALGLYEITTYSFIGKNAVDPLNLPESDPRQNGITLINPLGDEYSVLRTQLVTSMLTVLSTNYNRKNAAARLFEVSKRFVPKSLPITEQPLELYTLSIGLYGEGEDFFQLKGIVEQVLNSLGAKAKFTVGEEPYLHPGRQAKALLNDKTVAVFGELHPATAETYEIGTRAYVAEIYLDQLMELEQPKIIYAQLPKYPAVVRDLALLCDKGIPVGDLNDTILAAGGKLLEDVTLFDVYSGSQIPEGKKSVAYSLTLRSKEETLKDEQVDAAVAKIIKKLEAIGASLRQ